jgi:cytochrome c-type protein NapB
MRGQGVPGLNPTSEEIAMKFKIAFVAAVATLLGGGLQADPVALMDDAIGLSKTSVFDDPAPPEVAYSSLDPKQSGILPRFWEDAPPQVPHRLDKFLPITAKANKCLECHEEPKRSARRPRASPRPCPSPTM